MKRTFRRKKRLDAFMLDINDFERLWAKLLAQFDNPKGVSVSFEVELQEETFTFQNIKEIKRCSELSDSITKYSLCLIQDGRFLRLESEDNSSFGHKRATIWATGDNVGWCAGVIETSVSFLRKYRVWYRWIYSDLAKFITSFTLAVVIIAFCYKPLEKIEIGISPSIVWLVWFVSVPSLHWSISWLLNFLTKRILPANVIRTSEKEKFIRRRGTEIVLILTVISVIIAAITLLIQL